jgi:hypothetical protein
MIPFCALTYRSDGGAPPGRASGRQCPAPVAPRRAVPDSHLGLDWAVPAITGARVPETNMAIMDKIWACGNRGDWHERTRHPYDDGAATQWPPASVRRSYYFTAGLGDISAAWRRASIMLRTSTIPLPAMSNAVPWSTEVHGQAHGDVDADFEAEDLDGAMALVVVHRDDQVVVAAAGQEEGGVGRERADGVDPVGLELLDGRGDLLRFLAVTEEAVLPRVRVAAASS